jgi:hypothetical protein
VGDRRRPDLAIRTPNWPVPLQAAVWVVVLGAVTALNFAIRRRFVPR